MRCGCGVEKGWHEDGREGERQRRCIVALRPSPPPPRALPGGSAEDANEEPHELGDLAFLALRRRRSNPATLGDVVALRSASARPPAPPERCRRIARAPLERRPLSARVAHARATLERRTAAQQRRPSSVGATPERRPSGVQRRRAMNEQRQTRCVSQRYGLPWLQQPVHLVGPNLMSSAHRLASHTL